MTALLDDRMTENVINFDALYKLKQFPKKQRCEESTVWMDGGRIGIVGKLWPHVCASNVMKQVQFLVSHEIGQSVILGSLFMEENNLGEELLVEPRLVDEYFEYSDAISNVEHFPKTEKVAMLTTSSVGCSVGLYKIINLKLNSCAVANRMA